jgi:hypothetical protein
VIRHHWRAAEQTDAADEAGASDGASPLICVLGGRKVSEPPGSRV